MYSAEELYYQHKALKSEAKDAVKIICDALVINESNDFIKQLTDLNNAIISAKKNKTSNKLRLLSLIFSVASSIVNAAITVGARMIGMLARILANPYALSAILGSGLVYAIYDRLKAIVDNEEEPVPFEPTLLGSSDALTDAINNAARQTGIDAELLKGIAQAESSYGKYRKSATSSAKGAFQITDSTWKAHAKEFGLATRSDETDALFSALYIKRYILPTLKRIVSEPTPADVYALYVFGPTQGAEFLKHVKRTPNAPAAKTHRANQVKANKPLFFKKDGTMRTYKELYDILEKKVAYTKNAEEVKPIKPVTVKNEHETTDDDVTEATNVFIPVTPTDSDDSEIIEKDGKLFRVHKK